MIMIHAVFKRTGGIDREYAGTHTKKFLTEKCLKVFWVSCFENLTENQARVLEIQRELRRLFIRSFSDGLEVAGLDSQ
jgi:hypothetical protein